MKICLISAPDPNKNGGIPIYAKNIVKNIPKEDEVYFVYLGKENREYTKDRVNYVEFKVPFQKTNFLKKFFSIMGDILFNLRVKQFLEENYFDIINSHAIWGYWMKGYRRKENQNLVHTYHGVTYNFFKTHLERFGLIGKLFYSPSLLYGRIIEKPPLFKADKIICVSNKVEKQLKELYNVEREMEIIRTGVDLNEFKPLGKKEVKKSLNLEDKYSYFLFIGAGSGWNKGLDRAIKLSEEIYKLNKNFRLILIGPRYDNVKNFVEKPFVIFKKKVPREEVKYYYAASDAVFALSRYEGGAPTLVVSEAMASGCLLICSRESDQEIIENKKNGIIFDDYGEKEAREINEIIKDGEKLKNILYNSKRTIRDISMKKWFEEYYKVLVG